RSERPAFELHYPHMIERIHAEAHVGGGTSHGARTEVEHAGGSGPLSSGVPNDQVR
ncbi:cytochrome c oxidase subunit 1, partial [Williamsia sterculiae]